MKNQEIPTKLRILHCADIHLDSAFSKTSVKKGEQRRAELRAVFSDMMKYAKNGNIDILLIAGDLFDGELATSETLSLLQREFSECRIPVFISPGNHDFYSEQGIYALKSFSQNVHVFKSEELECVNIDELNTAVYGWAFCDIFHRHSPIAQKKVSDASKLNLICGHADLNSPLSEQCPVTKSDIENFGADYAAFGHIHVNPEQKSIGKTAYAYSGCLEGRSFDECGIGGAWLIEAEKGERGYSISAKRLHFGRSRFEVLTLDVTGDGDISRIKDKVASEIKRLGLGANTSLRVILVGSVPLSLSLNGIEDDLLGLEYIEYKNNTSPTYDASYLESDMTIKGEFYRYLLPRLTEGSPEEREVAANALKIGLAALENREITTQMEI